MNALAGKNILTIGSEIIRHRPPGVSPIFFILGNCGGGIVLTRDSKFKFFEMKFEDF